LGSPVHPPTAEPRDAVARPRLGAGTDPTAKGEFGYPQRTRTPGSAYAAITEAQR